MIEYKLILASSLFFLALSLPVYGQENGWSKLDSTFGYQYLDLSCLDDENCVAIGQFSNTMSFVRRTGDGGQSWEMIYIDSANFTDPPYRFPLQGREIEYLTPASILVACDSGIILRTTDSGNTWSRTQLSNRENSTAGLSMFDQLHGVIAQLPQSIFTTSDGGETWEPASALPEQIQGLGINDLAMPSQNTIIGHLTSFPTEWKVLISHDGGKSWEITHGPANTARIMFIDSVVGWAVGVKLDSLSGFNGEDVIQHTVDGGKTWSIQLQDRIPPTFGLYTIDFLDSLNGIAGGPLGKILHTSDGGQSWRPQYPALNPNSFPNVTAIQYTSFIRAFAVTGSGIILRYDTSPASTDADGAEHRSLHVSLAASVVTAGANARVFLPAAESRDIDIAIIDNLGRMPVTVTMQEENTGSPEILELPTNMLHAGHYFVVLRIGERVSVLRLLIL